jgi:hypothetical protein
MLRGFMPETASDDDAPYGELAVAAARRYMEALEAKRYSEIWHGLADRRTWGIFAAVAYLRDRGALADVFRMPPEQVTREFLSYALDNDLERARRGLWEGVGQEAKGYGWSRTGCAATGAASQGDTTCVDTPIEGAPPLTSPIKVPA